MTYVSKILSQMPGVLKPQQKAILALLSALMCFSGRATMRNLARYGAGSAKRLRRWASEGFDFFKLNELLLSETLAISFDQRENERPRQAILIDATFTAKSGKHIEGLNFFHNGSCKSKYKLQRGLEFNLIAALNIDEREAYALDTHQSNRESALDVACAQLIKHKNTYQKISQHVVADGYYARDGFVSALKTNGYELTTLLRRDAALRYIYEGEYSGRGRPKRYLGKVDYHDLSTWDKDETLLDDKVVYSKIVNYKSWNRDLKVLVIVNTSGEHRTICSTDLSLSAAEILELYQLRFQIEFLFRDAKQHTGLGHAQTLDAPGQEHFANASFTALNLFRLEERDEAIIADQSRQERVSSIRSLKSYKHHRFILNLFISRLALSRDDKNLEAVIEEVSRVGAVAA